MTGIDVVIKRPGKNPIVKNTANTLTNFQEKVNGNIELWPCANRVIMVVNEDGRRLHNEAVRQKEEFIRNERDEIDPKLLPFLICNFYTGGEEFFLGLERPIYGPAIFCGDAGDDFGTLGKKNIENLKKMLSEEWVL